MSGSCQDIFPAVGGERCKYTAAEDIHCRHAGRFRSAVAEKIYWAAEGPALCFGGDFIAADA